ncbi:hypothetical protein GQ457_17G008850 [Hibiscus cannabinus]
MLPGTLFFPLSLGAGAAFERPLPRLSPPSALGFGRLRSVVSLYSTLVLYVLPASMWGCPVHYGLPASTWGLLPWWPSCSIWQLVAVLAVGASWILSCFASFFLAWCTSVELVLWTSRLRTILRFLGCCAYGVALMFRPSQRPSCGKEPAVVTNACFEQSPKAATVGNHPRCTRPLPGCLRPMLGLLGAVPTAWFMLPPQATLDATASSTLRGLLVSTSPCLRLVSWLLDRPLCGAGLVARLCVRLAACLAEWMTLERFGSMARPPAFVQGRATTDSILVAHEIVHTLHTSVSQSSQGAVFKLDMEKAFDRVEWPFLKAIMLRLGFAPSWVNLIMRCVSSVSSRVHVRGALSEAFRPQRGLRQGDPLSPFLFLFCMEGLSAALAEAQHEGRLLGVCASKHGPPVNHLLFADDSLVFLRNNMSEFRWQQRGGSYLPCRAAGPIGGAGEHWSGLAWMLLGAWLWPPRGRCLPLQHSCATRSPRFDVGLPCTLWPTLVAMVSLMSNGLLEYGEVMYRPAYCMHGTVALLATAWLIWCLAWPTDWACYFAVVGIMGGVTVDWCASRGTPMPSFAAVLVPPAAADPPRWRPPPAGSVKVNVDGAFLLSARLGAIGVIARDSSGAVLGGFAKPVPVHGHASTVEVSALSAGLEFAIANGWPSALIESDAAVLVNKLHRPTVDLSLLGDLLAPFRALLAASDGCLRVGCLCVGFASRSANSAAHALASWACHNDNVLSFSSVCPELISRNVLDDLSSSF